MQNGIPPYQFDNGRHPILVQEQPMMVNANTTIGTLGSIDRAAGLSVLKTLAFPPLVT